MLLSSRLTLLCVLAHAIAIKIFRIILTARGIVSVEEESGNRFAVATNRTLMDARRGAGTVVWGLEYTRAWRAGSPAFAINVNDLRQRSFDPRHGGMETRKASLRLRHGQLALVQYASRM